MDFSSYGGILDSLELIFNAKDITLKALTAFALCIMHELSKENVIVRVFLVVEHVARLPQKKKKTILRDAPCKCIHCV